MQLRWSRIKRFAQTISFDLEFCVWLLMCDVIGYHTLGKDVIAFRIVQPSNQYECWRLPICTFRVRNNGGLFKSDVATSYISKINTIVLERISLFILLLLRFLPKTFGVHRLATDDGCACFSDCFSSICCANMLRSSLIWSCEFSYFPQYCSTSRTSFTSAFETAAKIIIILWHSMFPRAYFVFYVGGIKQLQIILIAQPTLNI